MLSYLPTTLGLLDYILYNKNVCGLMIFFLLCVIRDRTVDDNITKM